MNLERVLDALIAASTSSTVTPDGGARQLNFLEEVLRFFSTGASEQTVIDDLFSLEDGSTLPQLTRAARARLGRTPGPTRAAELSVTGLFLTAKARFGLIGGLAGLGAHFLFRGIVLKALNVRAQGVADPSSQNREIGRARAEPTEADSLLFARTMISALLAAGCIRSGDLQWIVEAFQQSGLDQEDRTWLLAEFSQPAEVSELAMLAREGNKRALAYTAAAVAIDTREPRERQFLDQLAEAMHLDRELRDRIDQVATSLKSNDRMDVNMPAKK